MLHMKYTNERGLRAKLIVSLLLAQPRHLSRRPLALCKSSKMPARSGAYNLIHLQRASHPFVVALTRNPWDRYIGVSEYPLDLLERANEVAHIDAFQVELSPFSPEVSKNGLLQWCEKSEQLPHFTRFLSSRARARDCAVHEG